MIDKALYWRNWRNKKKGVERKRFLKKGRQRYHANKKSISQQKKGYYVENKDRILRNVKAYQETVKRQMLEDAFERTFDVRDGFPKEQRTVPNRRQYKGNLTRHERRIKSGYYETEGYKNTLGKYRSKKKDDYLEYYRNRYYINRMTVILANIMLLVNMHQFVFTTRQERKNYRNQ